MTACDVPSQASRLAAPPRRLSAVASAALPELAPAQLCESAAAAGLHGVEWGVGTGQALPLGAPDAVVEVLRRAGARSGVACCGLAVHDGLALESGPGVWQRLAAAAETLGAPYVRVYATPGPAGRGSAGGFGDTFALLRGRLAKAADIVAANGRRLLLEPAPATLVPDPALAVQALAAADQDRVGVVYDPGSLAREGWLDPFLATEVLGGLLRHVHVKNTSPVRDADGVWTWGRSALASGIVDWPRVFRALDRIGYGGWLVLDHLTSHTPACLESELEFLRKLAEGGSDGV